MVLLSGATVVRGVAGKNIFFHSNQGRKYMKKLLVALTVLSLALCIALPARADELRYDVDFITVDVKSLIEPSGKATFTVETPGKIDDVYVKQMLQDAVTPVVEDTNTMVKKICEDAQIQLDNLTQGKKSLSEEEQKKVIQLVKKVNDDYATLVQAANVAAQKRLNDTWEKLKKEDKVLRNHRIKVGLKIGKEAFKIAANVATLVASMGADVTAYISIAMSVKNLFVLAKTELEGLGTKQEVVMTDIEKLKKSLDDNKNKLSTKKMVWKKFYESFISDPRENLEKSVKELELKMISARRSIQGAAKSLDGLLEATQALDEGPARQKAESKINSTIQKIIDSNDKIEVCAQLAAKGKEIVKEAEKEESLLQQVAKKAATALQLGQQAKDVISQVVDTFEDGAVSIQDVIGIAESLL